MKNELVKTKGNELVFNNELDEKTIAMMESDAENYQDDTAAEDIAIPRINLLQSGSKQVKKAEAEYIKGAEEGDLFNTLTKEVIAGDVGIYFVPVKRRVVYIHWKDIDAGGGLIENFGEDPTAFNKVEPNETGHRRTSDTTEIVKTHETFGFVIDPKVGTFTEVLLGLASTNEKKQKVFNSLIRQLRGTKGQMLPEYAGVYKITTTPEKNDKGSWYTFNFTAAGKTLALGTLGANVYEAGKKFREMILNNDINVKYDQDVTEEAFDASDETM
jgi:hypothetical protein